MRTHLTKIGNSRGVILPRHLIRESNIRDFVLITKTASGILIKGVDSPRDGWEESFIKAGAKDDNERVLTETVLNKADEEWTW